MLLLYYSKNKSTTIERSRTSGRGNDISGSFEKMKNLGNYECDGQIELTDYLKSKIKSGQVKDLTAWINSQGQAQYAQIGEVVRDAYKMYKDDAEVVGRITNAVSVYVLNQSMGYMKYLRSESEV